MITIKEVNTKKEIKTFIKFYVELYKTNKYCAIPLNFDEFKIGT